jgi:hypothetical protein
MSGFDWGVVVALGLFGVTQIGGGLWLIATLKTKSDGFEKKVANLESLVGVMQSRFDAQLAAMRTESHSDLNGIRTEMTRLAVEVGRVIGAQDATKG